MSADEIFDLQFIPSYDNGVFKFLIVGTDEVGRGPLAGPVVAGSVALFIKISPVLTSPLVSPFITGRTSAAHSLGNKKNYLEIRERSNFLIREKIAQLLQTMQDSGINDSKLLSASARRFILQTWNIPPGHEVPIEEVGTSSPISDFQERKKFLSKQDGIIFWRDSCLISTADKFGDNDKYNASFMLETIMGTAVCEISHDEIDRINIMAASLKAMGISYQCISEVIKIDTNLAGSIGITGSNEVPNSTDLPDLPAVLLIDGNQRINLNHSLISEIPIVKGDQKSMLIGLAAIVAKDYRDSLMNEMDKKYPGYGWSKNMGYPTIEHRKAIAQLGRSPIHRQSFHCEV